MNLTPQESEQLSQYVSDDNYVKQQKMDIAELSSMYRDLLGAQTGENSETEYIGSFRSHFVPQPDFKAGYSFQIEGKSKPLYIHVDGADLVVTYGEQGSVDVYARLSSGVLNDIIGGRETFQRAFGVGDMTAKGNLRILRMLDTIFAFAS